MDDDFDYDDDYRDGCACPRCSGMGSVDCDCGGDLCACTNYGERDCPLCQGEGEVTQEVWDRWHKPRQSPDAP